MGPWPGAQALLFDRTFPAALPLPHCAAAWQRRGSGSSGEARPRFHGRALRAVATAKWRQTACSTTHVNYMHTIKARDAPPTTPRHALLLRHATPRRRAKRSQQERKKKSCELLRWWHRFKPKSLLFPSPGCALIWVIQRPRA